MKKAKKYYVKDTNIDDDHCENNDEDVISERHYSTANDWPENEITDLYINIDNSNANNSEVFNAIKTTLRKNKNTLETVEFKPIENLDKFTKEQKQELNQLLSQCRNLKKVIGIEPEANLFRQILKKFRLGNSEKYPQRLRFPKKNEDQNCNDKQEKDITKNSQALPDIIPPALISNNLPNKKRKRRLGQGNKVDDQEKTKDPELNPIKNKEENKVALPNLNWPDNKTEKISSSLKKSNNPKPPTRSW